MLIELLFLLGFLLLFVYVARNTYFRVKQIKQMREFDFDWYREEFPELTKDGTVTCYKCKSGHVSTERLMQRTFMRRHVCKSCGTTLFYSPEE